MRTLTNRAEVHLLRDFVAERLSGKPRRGRPVWLGLAATEEIRAADYDYDMLRLTGLELAARARCAGMALPIIHFTFQRTSTGCVSGRAVRLRGRARRSAAFD